MPDSNRADTPTGCVKRWQESQRQILGLELLDSYDTTPLQISESILLRSLFNHYYDARIFLVRSMCGFLAIVAGRDHSRDRRSVSRSSHRSP